MDAVQEITKKNYNEVTKDLLDRTKLLKTQVKINGTIGDTYIIAGIELFEDVIKDLNLVSIDNTMVEFIENSVERLLIETEEKKQVVNQYTKYGIVCCYTILEGYNKRINRKEAYSRKKIIDNYDI